MFYLKRNLPVWERLLRLCSAIVVGLGSYFFVVDQMWQILGYVTAVMLASTAIIGFCPACALFGRKI